MDFNQHSTHALILAANKIAAQHMENKLQLAKAIDSQKDLMHTIEESKLGESKLTIKG